MNKKWKNYSYEKCRSLNGQYGNLQYVIRSQKRCVLLRLLYGLLQVFDPQCCRAAAIKQHTTYQADCCTQCLLYSCKFFLRIRFVRIWKKRSVHDLMLFYLSPFESVRVYSSKYNGYLNCKFGVNHTYQAMWCNHMIPFSRFCPSDRKEFVCSLCPLSLKKVLWSRPRLSETAYSLQSVVVKTAVKAHRQIFAFAVLQDSLGICIAKNIAHVFIKVKGFLKKITKNTR